MTLLGTAALMWLLGGVGIVCAFFLRVEGFSLSRRSRTVLVALSCAMLAIGMTTCVGIVMDPGSEVALTR